MEQDVILKFENITKYFPGVVANRDINLDIRRGEVHTLLGENGAGKSTLMNILYGLYCADEGQIYLDGEPVNILSPNDAMEMRIGMIHQHFMLIPNFTVWENMVLGKNMKDSVTLPVEEIKKEIEEVASRLHMEVNPDELILDLPIGVQQKVEILKAIYRGSRILVLDEPTSVLTPQESEDLFVTIRKLKDDGCTIIFISHKMDEVMDISDRISVLRDGELIVTLEKSDCTPATLTSLMVGREVDLKVSKTVCCRGNAAIEVRDIVAKGDTYSSSLKGISLSVCCGEIVGIAGVDGNGQSELARIIAGVAEPESGQVFIEGEDVTSKGVRLRSDLGLSYVPADRRGEGLVLDFKVYENAALTEYHHSPYSEKGILKLKKMQTKSQEYIDRFHIKTPSSTVSVKTLSGGNQQKLILAREMLKEPKIMLIVQPTWGLDIGACSFVYEKIIEERDRGTAIILISTDLEEVRSLSDRLLVIYRGEIMDEVDPVTTEVSKIGLLMTGIRDNDKIEKRRERSLQ